LMISERFGWFCWIESFWIYNGVGLCRLAMAGLVVLIAGSWGGRMSCPKMGMASLFYGCFSDQGYDCESVFIEFYTFVFRWCTKDCANRFLLQWFFGSVFKSLFVMDSWMSEYIFWTVVSILMLIHCITILLTCLSRLS
jgi:hypothetical protein